MKAIHEYPRPMSKNQVRAFLGLAGYYRCFIPCFSSLASPVTDLTKKGQPDKVQWSPAAEEAFQNQKTAMFSFPVLHTPDFSQPTDFSHSPNQCLRYRARSGLIPDYQRKRTSCDIYQSEPYPTRDPIYAAIEKEALAVKWLSWRSFTTS